MDFDTTLIETIYLHAYRSILREKGFNNETARIRMISEKGIGIYYAVNLNIKAKANIQYNVLALERYLKLCDSYEPKTEFMELELKNGKIYANTLKNRILCELF